MPFRNAIVFTVKMAKEALDTAPSYECFREVERGYLRLAVAANRMTELMRSRGFGAYPGTAMGGLALAPRARHTYIAVLTQSVSLGGWNMTSKTQRGIRLPLVAMTALAALLTQGCAPSWKVVRSSGPPSALKDAQEILVGFDYSQLRVSSMSGDEMGEQEWVATKLQEDPKYAETWADLKHRFEQGVLEGAQAQVDGALPIRPIGQEYVESPGSVVLQVQLRSFKLGQWVPFVLPPTVLKTEFIWRRGGQVTDEILVERVASHDIIKPSVFSVIGGLSRSVGNAGGSYINAMRQ